MPAPPGHADLGLYSLGQHENQSPGSFPVPAMQFRMSVMGKSGRLHPSYDRYPTKLLHQRVQRGGKGACSSFLGTRAIGALAVFGVLWHQLSAFFDRSAVAAEIVRVFAPPRYPRGCVPQSAGAQSVRSRRRHGTRARRRPRRCRGAPGGRPGGFHGPSGRQRSRSARVANVPDGRAGSRTGDRRRPSLHSRFTRRSSPAPRIRSLRSGTAAKRRQLG